MKIYFGVTRFDGKAMLHAYAGTSNLSPAHRELLCNFAHAMRGNPEQAPPQRLRDFVLVRTGIENEKRFVEYAENAALPPVIAVASLSNHFH